MPTNVVRGLARAVVQHCVFATRPRTGPPSRRYRKERAYVLAYHSVCPQDDPYLPYIGANLSVTPDAFARHIAFLVRHYEVVSLSTLARHLDSGYDGDRPLVALTFDDGYRDNYRFAYPILRRNGVPATFFLTTDCIDSDSPLWPMEASYVLLNTTRSTLRLKGFEITWDLSKLAGRRAALRGLKNYLTDLPRTQRERALGDLRSAAKVNHTDWLCEAMLRWSEVREMRDAGMEFGSHTCSHPSLPYIPLDEARDEIALSKARLEEAIDASVLHFCYPNPAGRVNFNETLDQIVISCGYQTSATSQDGYVQIPGSPYDMNRKGVYGNFSGLAAFYCRLEEDTLNKRPDTSIRRPVDGAPASK
jgi:peptidoglycan/xylan/chitin deacetylase (PgdA/CDA1 family)